MSDSNWSHLTGLDRAMASSAGDPSVVVGLLDGPVDARHPGFAEGSLVAPAPPPPDTSSARHGTAVAGVLAADRNGTAPGICPGCRVFVRPIFDPDGPATSRPRDLADGIEECVVAGARIINISAGFKQGGFPVEVLGHALDLAGRRGVIVVVAAGNQGRVSGSPLVSHPHVVPVTSCDGAGRPLPNGNLCASAGRRGVRAPGVEVETLAPGGGVLRLSGTSLSTVLVTGALALAWSVAPAAPAALLLQALSGPPSARRRIVPPLLNAVTLVRAASSTVPEPWP
ncbi:S8 family serine peptidase [Streptomyces sp. NPDC048338]|uniref:S8 family serine peptidase n=1 Tax=Streptomyces sp. NPDC048338 TaxID=3365536 RepID=UPI003721A605